jgi:multiple sugar transport system substrate-binding protein
VSIAPRLTRRDSLGNFVRSAVAIGTADNVNRAVDVLGLLMLQNGTPFYSQDRSRSTINQTVRDASGQGTNPGAQALEFYTQFADPAKTTYTWNALSNNSVEAFTSGQAAMIFSYSYLLPVLRDRAPFLNYDIAGAPQIEQNLSRVNIANYWAEAVAKQSPNQEAAHAFLKFISSREVLPKYYEVQKQASSRIDIIETQLTDPDIGVFAENALSAKSFFKPESDAVESIFIQMIEDVTLRDVEPESAVGAAEQKINLLLRNF